MALDLKDNKIEINNNINLSPVNADLTEIIDRAYDDGLKKPVKKTGNIITGLLGFIDETIDTGLFIYEENLKYYREKCRIKIQEKINKIPTEHIVQPDIGILGQTLENLKYNLDKEYLVDLYTSIIARNIDNRTKDKVLPSFVSIIKDLSYDDIQLLEAIYKYQEKDHPVIAIIKLEITSDNPKMDKTFKSNRYYISVDDYDFDIDSFGLSLENLIRLNLVTKTFDEYLKDTRIYENLRDRANIVYKPTFHSLEAFYTCECKVDIKNKGIIRLTNTGINLMSICLSDI